jgi:F0F1-type ATP synthase assembly protein I
MSSGLESLHKVLKDEKRRKIITLLNEKESLSYTELMNMLEISSTGKLNYHLKILNELIIKKEDGLYVLTEKGKLAVHLLQEFGERKSQSQIEAPFSRGYFIVVSLFSSVMVGLSFGLYLLGLVTFDRFVLYTVMTVLGFVFLVIAERARVKRSMLSANRQMLGAKISIIFAGAFAGAVVLFFGGGLLMVALVQAGFRTPFPSFTSWIITSMITGGVTGAFVGYLVYKKSRYSKPAYYNPFEA